MMQKFKILQILCGVFLCFTFSTTQADATDTIVLGAAVSLTGKYSVEGKLTLNGYQIAIDEVNKKGGVKVGDKTYKLEIKYYDDESTSARAAQLVERLVQQDGIKYILGPYSSPLTAAMAPITEKYKVPMIEANGADRKLFVHGYKYLFAVLDTSDYYLRDAIKLLAENAKQQGKNPKDLKIAIAIENDDFSQDVRDGVIEDANKYGMQIIINEKLPPSFTDMSSIIAKVKALKPDLLVVSGHEKGAALAVSQLAANKVDVPMLAMTHCDSAKIIDKYKKDANFTVCGSQWDKELGFTDKYFVSSGKFAKMYKERFKETPPYQAAESAAAVLVFADAFERANSLDPTKVRDAIASTNILTFYGQVKFDETGKNIAKSMVLYQVQNEQFTVVAPASAAKSKLIYPAPTWDKR